ncbi:hypothetical protein SUGI_1143680 [Cryptomeria japonica]|nr:hypothetical protein SUGI_1143680 [Cryptomeria japonica]
MMGKALFLALGVNVLLFAWDAAAQISYSSCPLIFTVGETKTYEFCIELNLGATLSFYYHVENRSLDIAFQAKPSASRGWVCWGINPQGLAMIGTQALIAFRLDNGSTVVGTYEVQSKSAALKPSKISLNVTSKSAVYESRSGKITIFASLVLDSNQTSVNLSPLNTLNSNCPIQFTDGGSKTYQFCTPLNLGATVSYIYHEQNRSLDIAFRAAPPASGGWVCWGINPKGLAMIGTQALIAFQLDNGTTMVDTYNVVSTSDALIPSKISLKVTSKSAVYEATSEMITIFASLVLDSNQTIVNLV